MNKVWLVVELTDQGVYNVLSEHKNKEEAQKKAYSLNSMPTTQSSFAYYSEDEIHVVRNRERN